MASTVNPVLAMQDPNFAALLPGRNPTGSQGSGANYVPSTGSSSGQNPVLPANNLPAGAPASNPYAPGSSVPTFGANSGGYPSKSLTGGTPLGGSFGNLTGNVGSFGNLSQSSLQSLSRDLTRTYGAGMAQAIMDFLAGGAGFNQDAVNNLIASLQPGFERSQQNLLQEFSTSGNRFSSGAQIGLADLMSQEQLNVGEIEAQMYQQSIQNFIDVLMGTAGTNAKRKASSPSFMDTLTSAIPLASDVAGSISQGFGLSDKNILSIIGNL